MSRTTTTTLSSLETESAKETFESIYQLLTRLKDETTSVRNTLTKCSKKIDSTPLSERLLEPRPHAVSWFKKHSLETPCDLEEFLLLLFRNLAAKRLVCHRTRTILLGAEEAILFQLTPMFAYRWTEVIANLPKVFY